MDKDVYTACCAIVEYLETDERKHSEEVGRPSKHIFTEVRKLAEHLGEIAKDYE